MQTGGGSSAGKMERATFGEPRVQYFHDFHPLEHIGSCTLLHASSKVYGCMQGRRLVMQGHYPRSSAAFLHGQAWPCFSIGECTAAHVHRISRRSVYYSVAQDAAVDLEAFFTRKDHAFIFAIHCRRSFLCSGYIGAAVHRRRLVFACAIVNTFFVVKCALYLAFLLRFIHWLRGSVVSFPHGTSSGLL